MPALMRASLRRRPALVAAIAASTLIACSGDRADSSAAQVPVAAASASRPTSEWQLASSLPLDRLERLARSATPDATGALSRNQPRYVSVRFQAGASWPLLYAGVTGNTTGAEQSLRALEYAARHQRADGSYEMATEPAFDRAPGMEGDSLSAAVLFLADAARALRLAATSSLASTDPVAPRLQARVVAQRESARRGLAWLGAQRDALARADAAAPDRLFADALAFYVGALATGDSAGFASGIRFAESALATQRADGVFLQQGGHDSSYQGVALLRAILLYANLRPEDRDLATRLGAVIEKGTAWEAARVAPLGEIISTGNTRVHAAGEMVLGQRRPIASGDVALALYYWAAVTGNGTYRAAAERVVSYYVD